MVVLLFEIQCRDEGKCPAPPSDHRRLLLNSTSTGLLPERPVAAAPFSGREREHPRRYQFNCRRELDADKKPEK
jgi:hypothetical protein